ncbi:MAG: RidA family protein [bacterium]
MQILQPAGWDRPRGYSNGILAEGKVVYVAGQVGWKPNSEMAADDFAGQARQALKNIVDILAEAGAQPSHITRMTWFVVGTDAYMAAGREVGQAYRELIGKHFPAMSVIGVAGLIEPGALLEIEATAVIPA